MVTVSGHCLSVEGWMLFWMLFRCIFLQMGDLFIAHLSPLKGVALAVCLLACWLVVEVAVIINVGVWECVGHGSPTRRISQKFEIIL